MDGFRVGRGAEEVAAGREHQRGNANAAHASSELLDPLSILDAEYPDDSAALGGGGQQSATGRECQCRKGRVVGLDRDAGTELARIEDAQLPAGLADGEGQQGVERKGAQALLVGGDVVNGMQDLHVANVMDVYALRQADYQTLAVHADAQNIRRVEAVADVLFLLEVQHLEAVRLLGSDQDYQGAIE